ncbi:hypothetical protein [Pseudomonas chlororaphis]|uniref:Membrane-associated oxidoreductase n=1 Tax=Pseudomonas chlororaphis TaxID=587753 RepID=A0A1Q8ENB5_9PSED|nr:hypothetical protein [Pseudomonas chlororaphis]OLF53290.1 hypothetical protein BTN82_17555 [Pseudomonas chlororaphis]
MAVTADRLLQHYKPLNKTEQKLLAYATTGARFSIAKTRPTAATAENTVRASFLRFLILGGDNENPINLNGIHLEGAFIQGILRLSSAAIATNVSLTHCLCKEGIRLENTVIDGWLDLSGSQFSGVAAQYLCVRSSLEMRAFHSQGTICLIGAKIAGSLIFSGAQLDGKGHNALEADRCVVDANIVFEDEFSSLGEVRLNSATMKGLKCSNCTFTATGGIALNADKARVSGSVFLSAGFHSIGTVRFTAARIDGQLSLKGSHHLDGNGSFSLMAQNMIIGRTLMLTQLEHPLQNVAFSGSHVRTLNDDSKTWGNELGLNGFTYDFLTTDSPLRAKDRIAWLDSQTPSSAGKDGLKGSQSGFLPQPWLQLKHVFEKMGHFEEAREVGIAFEQRLRKAGLVGHRTAHWPWGTRWLGLIPHVLYGALTGFGYRPMRLLAWILGIWLLFTSLYWYAAVEHNVFAPSNPLVFQNSAYASCRKEYGEGWIKRSPDTPLPSGIGNWYTCNALRGEYTGFSPGAYSLDILLSLVDLQQEKDWGPITATPSPNAWVEFWNWDWGHSIRFLVWLETLIGWGISLLLVAIVSGLTRRKE